MAKHSHRQTQGPGFEPQPETLIADAIHASTRRSDGLYARKGNLDPKVEGCVVIR
jgi:hypothetical protein